MAKVYDFQAERAKRRPKERPYPGPVGLAIFIPAGASMGVKAGENGGAVMLTFEVNGSAALTVGTSPKEARDLADQLVRSAVAVDQKRGV
jgi:hypothetical protein